MTTPVGRFRLSLDFYPEGVTQKKKLRSFNFTPGALQRLIEDRFPEAVEEEDDDGREREDDEDQDDEDDQA